MPNNTEKATKILQKTNNGKDLSEQQIDLIENAVKWEGRLEPEVQSEFEKLYIGIVGALPSWFWPVFIVLLLFLALFTN